MSTTDPGTADGWETHRRIQLVNGLNATPLQRMRWLEEAIAFCFRAGALPKTQDHTMAAKWHGPASTAGEARTGQAVSVEAPAPGAPPAIEHRTPGA